MQSGPHGHSPVQVGIHKTGRMDVFLTAISVVSLHSQLFEQGPTQLSKIDWCIIYQ